MSFGPLVLSTIKLIQIPGQIHWDGTFGSHTQDRSAWNERRNVARILRVADVDIQCRELSD